jgi:Spy/CpxP family protein refolding chaperone
MADLTQGSTRRTAAALLVAVFVLGAVCGAALFYLGQRSVRPAHREAGGPPGPDHPMARMTRDLDLDPEQRAAIREILEEQRVQLGTFLEGSREKIREVLRPDQQERFDVMRPADPAHPGGPPPGHRPPPPGHRPPPLRNG